MKVACHFPFWERSKVTTLFSLSGAKVPGDVSSMERKFQGAKVPGNESSTHGTFAPGSESTWERKFQLPTERMTDAFFISFNSSQRQHQQAHTHNAYSK